MQGMFNFCCPFLSFARQRIFPLDWYYVTPLAGVCFVVCIASGMENYCLPTTLSKAYTYLILMSPVFLNISHWGKYFGCSGQKAFNVGNQITLNCFIGSTRYGHASHAYIVQVYHDLTCSPTLVGYPPLFISLKSSLFYHNIIKKTLRASTTSSNLYKQTMQDGD